MCPPTARDRPWRDRKQPASYEIPCKISGGIGEKWCAVRKLARDQAQEVAVGAIAAGGIELWDSRREEIPIEEQHQILAKEAQELKRRQQYFGS